MIQASDVVDNLTLIGPTPTTESQARAQALANAAPELVRIVKAGGAEAEICAFLIAANKDVLRHLALNA
jgi:hypothetical protein